MTHKHPVNQRHIDQATLGERLADRMAAGIGSWRFLIVQTFLVALWVSINLTGLILRWDPYPFILLNLMFSVQAAYTGPILLLAGNRAAQKDRAMLEHDAWQTDQEYKMEQQMLDLMTGIKETLNGIKQESGQSQ